EAVVLGRRGHDTASPARLWPMVRRYCSVSSNETTSAYLALRSNRLCSCAATERSPTASRTTIGRKPFCTASTALARTHPLVVHPTTISVSTRRLVSRGTRSVPKKQEAYFFRSRLSPGLKSRRGSISCPSVSRARVTQPFCL